MVRHDSDTQADHLPAIDSGSASSSAPSSRKRPALSSKTWLFLLLILASALALVAIYLGGEPSTESDVSASGPRLVKMERQSKLVEELMNHDRACLYEFSGMLLELWLEATVEVPDKDPRTIKGLSVAMPHYGWKDEAKPTADRAIGQFAVWGGDSSNARHRLNLSLRTGARSVESDGKELAFSKAEVDLRSKWFAPSLEVPWPEGLPKSSGGFHGNGGIQSLIPKTLPPVGETFPVFRYEMSDWYKDSREEQVDVTKQPDLKVTIQLMARRLPFESPRPHEDEANSVTSLRDRGFLVIQEGSQAREHEGNDGGRAIRVHGGSYRIKGSANPTDEDMHQIATLLQTKEIDLWRANLTDRGLKHLTSLEQLTTLEIRCEDKATVTAEGFAAIGQLQSLERLVLEGITVADEAVPHIQKLTNLQQLYIHRGCDLTADGVEQLKTALPNAEVTCR